MEYFQIRKFVVRFCKYFLDKIVRYLFCIFFFLSWAGYGNLWKILLFQQKRAWFTITGAHVLNPSLTHFNHSPPLGTGVI